MSTPKEEAAAAVERMREKYRLASQQRADKEYPLGVPLPLDVAQAQIRALREKSNLPVPSLEERLRQRCVPDKIAKLIMAGALRETDATGLAFGLADGDGVLLILASEPGRGKSVAGGWALSQHAGLFVPAEALARIDATGSLDAWMKTCNLLVIDDVGLEHSPSGFAASRLDAIVTGRVDHAKRTILTTNMKPEQFREKYGGRILSRANGDPLGWRELGGPDLRRAT